MANYYLYRIYFYPCSTYF